jgi:hypothetical protein
VIDRSMAAWSLSVRARLKAATRLTAQFQSFTGT